MKNLMDVKKRINDIEIPNTIKLFLPALIALVVISIITAIFSDAFLTEGNILNVLNQATMTGIMAIGVTFVMVSGHIDISSGAAVALCGLIGASLCTKYGVHPFIAILVVFAIGILIGALNGFLVAHVGLVPFIATMGTMNMFKGIALIYSKSMTVHSIPELFTIWGGSKVFGVIPSGIVISLVLYAIGHFILTKTVFGHEVYASGGNKYAARLAGIDEKKKTLIVYMIAGLCYAIAGIILTGRVGAAYPTAAEGSEMDVIAGIVIGGTAMSGGRGTHIGTWIGVLLVALINNAINLLGISAYATKFIQGSIIIMAVSAEVIRNKIRAKNL